MIDRMSDDEFNNYAETRIKAEAERSRNSEEHLKAQILGLFDYLFQNFLPDILNDKADGACKTAIEIMENQRTKLEVYGNINMLKEEEPRLKD